MPFIISLIPSFFSLLHLILYLVIHLLSRPGSRIIGSFIFLISLPFHHPFQVDEVWTIIFPIPWCYSYPIREKGAMSFELISFNLGDCLI